MLEIIKSRLGIDSAVTVYDEELTSLISAAVADMKAAGVPDSLLEEDAEDDRAIMAVVCFVRQSYGEDRTSITRYQQMYQAMVFRLCQEEGGS